MGKQSNRGPPTVLMKDCPNKWSEKIKEMFFFCGKGSWSSPRLSAKKDFDIGQVQIKILVENSVSVIQHIGSRKSFLKCFPPLTKLIFWFTLYT